MIELTRIELENFRPFAGKHNIDIKISDKKLIIFAGNTGDGKTSLTNAIQWCLFGSSQNDSDSLINNFSLFNDGMLLKSKLNEIVTCRVTLTFERENDDLVEKTVFSRSMQVKRKKSISSKEGPIHPNVEDFEFCLEGGSDYEKFSIFKWEGDLQVPLDTSVKRFRDTYFPDLVREYYIIYGEQFVDPSNSSKIKLAVERNCFADIFDKIKENLENTKIELIKMNTSEKKKKEKLDELIDLRKDLLSSIEDKKESEKSKREEFDLVSDAISKIDKNIGKSGGGQAEILRDERADLEVGIKNLDREIRGIEKKLLGDSFKLLIKIWSSEFQLKFSDELNKLIKKGEIPPNIKTEFINSLIEGKKCICKRPITENEKKILIALRDENIIGSNYNDFLNLKYQIESDRQLLKSNWLDYSKQLESVEKLKENRLRDQHRIKRISDELETLKNVDKLESDRKKYVSHKGRLEAEIEQLKDDKDEDEKRLKGVKHDIDKIGNVNQLEKNELNIFIENIASTITKVKENLIESTRKGIEEFTSNIYLELFKNTSEVERVQVSPDYKVSVILKKNNKEYIKTKFSTGEGLVFAISFLSALRKYSGYNGPIFLDSPFSVLDDAHRVAVSTNIPKAIPGQLIILTREDTFNDIKEKLTPYLNQIYTLKKKREWETEISKEGAHGK